MHPLSEIDWELMIPAFPFTRSTFTMMESHRASSPQDYGEDYYKGNFRPISWSTWKILWILDKLKMDLINSSLFNNKDVHILHLTLNTLEVAIIYLLNGKLGRWEPFTNIMANVKHCRKFKARWWLMDTYQGTN